MNYGSINRVYLYQIHHVAVKKKRKERKKNNDASFSRDGFLVLKMKQVLILKKNKKAIDNGVHVFSVTVGTSKIVDEHEQLSARIRDETLMSNVITPSEAGPPARRTKFVFFCLLGEMHSSRQHIRDSIFELT